MTELNNILPPDLKTTLDNLDYEGEGYISALSIQYLANDLLLDFSVFPAQKQETQYWQLRVQNCRDSKLDTNDLGDGFRFYTDHFLLWEFTDNQTELYVKEGTPNPERLLADIYTVHNTVFDNHIPLEKYINGSNLLALCKSQNGLFSRGPKRILEHYHDCLLKNGKAPYYFGDSIPKKYENGNWAPEDTNLKLALLGRTYFIGQDFFFERLS